MNRHGLVIGAASYHLFAMNRASMIRLSRCNMFSSRTLHNRGLAVSNISRVLLFVLATVGAVVVPGCNWSGDVRVNSSSHDMATVPTDDMNVIEVDMSGGCGLNTCATMNATCGPIGDGCGGMFELRHLHGPADLRRRRHAVPVRRHGGLHSAHLRAARTVVRPGRRRLWRHAQLRLVPVGQDVRRRRHGRRVRIERRRRRLGRQRRRLRRHDVRAARLQVRLGRRRLRQPAQLRHLHGAGSDVRRRRRSRSSAARPCACRRPAAARLQLRSGRRRLRQHAQLRHLHRRGQSCGGGGVARRLRRARLYAARLRHRQLRPGRRRLRRSHRELRHLHRPRPVLRRRRRPQRLRRAGVHAEDVRAARRTTAASRATAAAT